jgi:hypothetical protein
MRCSRFWSIIEEYRHGLSVEESHARVHGTDPESDGRLAAG